MPIIYVVVLAVAVLHVTETAADPKYMMPRELVEHAREIGCAQIEDFFDTRGMIGPPYVYGYVPGRPEDSAVFWCEKTQGGKRQFFLAIRGKADGVLGCPRLIPFPVYPGGLDIYREPTESLEQFTYLDAPKVKGPRGERTIHNAIRTSSRGLETSFYCHEGRWLMRSRD